MRFAAKSLMVAFVLLFASVTNVMGNDAAQHLQDISVTIRAPTEFGESQGSGVLITREIKHADGTSEVVNFVWTAGHVVEELRSTRTVIRDGKKTEIVEFKDAKIVQELVQKGRKVGEIKLDCKVILYSDSEDGRDLALLMVRKRNFVKASAEFYLKEGTVAIGTRLFHVGSLLGQGGHNSMTAGIMSQVGRVYNLGSGDGTIFDQTTCTAFPGSSGGGVFLAGDNRADVKYVGMLVRGAGEGFNLIVPVREMIKWAKDRDLMWTLDPKAKMPTFEDLKKLSIE